MKQSKWVIETNVAVASKTCLMVLRGDTSGIRPGQFVEIALPNLFLRRPISVCNIDGDRLTLIYKVVGEGTAVMSGLPAGTRLDIRMYVHSSTNRLPKRESLRPLRS